MAETPTPPSTPEAAPAVLADAPAPVIPAAPAPAPTPSEAFYPEQVAAETKAAASAAESEAPSAAPSEAEPSPEAEAEVEAEAEAEASAPALTAESYAELKVPETISVSEPMLLEFKELAAETGVAPEAAQRLVEFYAKASTEAAAAQIEAWNTTQAAWKTSIDAMPEFQGAQRAQSEAVLGAAIEEFGDPSVRDFFRMTGDHPGVVKMIFSMASALVEDGPTPQGNPVGSSAKRTPGQILYPNADN